MTFFFDRNVGTRVPRALALLGLPVEFHQDHFEQAAPDDQWLGSVGTKGWIVVGHDHKLHRRTNELQAIAQHNVGCFYLAGANATRWDKVRLIAKAYDKIVSIASSEPRPFVYRVLRDGRITRVL